MDCQRCGGSTVAYSLGERSARACEECGSVGVTAEHRSERVDAESWDEAIQRFYDHR